MFIFLYKDENFREGKSLKLIRTVTSLMPAVEVQEIKVNHHPDDNAFKNVIFTKNVFELNSIL